MSRAERERERYNQGLKREAYLRLFRDVDIYTAPKRLARVREVMAEKRGGSFLEIGSSTWRVWPEQVGAEPGELVCINISEAELAAGRAGAEGSRLQPRFQLMDAHKLQFPDNSFDLVYGLAILHHLTLSEALAEIDRVLRPGGRIVFAEPLAMNPVAMLVRWLTPFARTEDERPFGLSDIAALREHFDIELDYYDFLGVPLGMLSGLLLPNGHNLLTRAAHAADTALLSVVPGIGNLYRNVLITGRSRKQA